MFKQGGAIFFGYYVRTAFLCSGYLGPSSIFPCYKDAQVIGDGLADYQSRLERAIFQRFSGAGPKTCEKDIWPHEALGWMV